LSAECRNTLLSEVSEVLPCLMRQESEFLTVVGTINMENLYTNTNNQFMINFMAKIP